MILFFLEALAALLLLVFIVWWTMFSGRQKGELPDAIEADKAPGAEPSGRTLPGSGDQAS